MCGIMGVIGSDNAVTILVNGLQHLSYRGYDAAGVAVLTERESGQGESRTVERGIEIRKTAGNLDRLKNLLTGQPVNGRIG